jgi:hypothetical protein
MSIEMQQAIADDEDYQSAEEIRNEDNAAPKIVVNANDVIQPEEVKEPAEPSPI